MLNEASEWLTSGRNTGLETGVGRDERTSTVAADEEGNVVKIKEMFPEMEEDAIKTVLEAANHNFSLAVEAALVMSSDESFWGAGRPPPPPPPPPSLPAETGGGAASSQWESEVLEELRRPRRGKQVILPDDFLRVPGLYGGVKSGIRAAEAQPLGLEAALLTTKEEQQPHFFTTMDVSEGEFDPPSSNTDKSPFGQEELEEEGSRLEESVLKKKYHTAGEYSVRLARRRGGLGLTLRSRGGLLVVEGLYSGDDLPGPAERAGVQIGDCLLGVEAEAGVPSGGGGGVGGAAATPEELLDSLRRPEAAGELTLRFSRPADSPFSGLTKRPAFPARHRLPALLHEDDVIDAENARILDAQMTRLFARMAAQESGTFFPEWFEPAPLPPPPPPRRTLRGTLGNLGGAAAAALAGAGAGAAAGLPAALAPAAAPFSLAADAKLKAELAGGSGGGGGRGLLPIRPAGRVRAREALRPAFSVRVVGTDVGSEGEGEGGGGGGGAAVGAAGKDAAAGGEDGGGGGQQYTVYILWVQDIRSGAEWKVRRRFSHFRRLQEHISKLYPEIGALDFPRRVPETLTVINGRRRRLEAWVRSALALPYLSEAGDGGGGSSAAAGGEGGGDGGGGGTPSANGGGRRGEAQALWALQEFLGAGPRLESLRLLDGLPERDRRQRVQVWTHRLLTLPFFDGLLRDFVERLPAQHPPAPAPAPAGGAAAPAAAAMRCPGRALLRQMKRFINHLQKSLLEGCYKELGKSIGHVPCEFSEKNWQSEEKIQKIIAKAIRRQIESEVYIPLMSALHERLLPELQNDIELLSRKIRSTKGLGQGAFGIPPGRRSPSGWARARRRLREAAAAPSGGGGGGPALPCDRLGALVAAAHAVPELFRQEHPGEQDRPLGADEFLPIFVWVVCRAAEDEDAAAAAAGGAGGAAGAGAGAGAAGLAALAAVVGALCDPDERLAETGYYLATFEAALQHIRDFEVDGTALS